MFDRVLNEFDATRRQSPTFTPPECRAGRVGIVRPGTGPRTLGSRSGQDAQFDCVEFGGTTVVKVGRVGARQGPGIAGAVDSRGEVCSQPAWKAWLQVWRSALISVMKLGKVMTLTAKGLAGLAGGWCRGATVRRV